jgi:hypothetical protein
VSRAALLVELAGLLEAQLPVHAEADIGGVHIFLSIVFPPANGA